MNTYINKQCEEITTFQSHVHPECANFMQVVSYMIIVKPTGQTTVIWHLANCSANNYHHIYDMSKYEAIAKFTAKPVIEISEADYQLWLASK